MIEIKNSGKVRIASAVLLLGARGAIDALAQPMNAMGTQCIPRRRGGRSLNCGVRFVLAAFLGLLLFCPAMAGADIASKEYRLKAAFLYNFTKFVEWPPSRFSSPTSPIIIGILGSNPFGDELETIIKNRKVNGRPIEIRMIGAADEAASVHLLFVGAGRGAAIRPVLESLRRNNVLTVGESSDFAALGGIITFVPEGDKIRFAVNLSSGERSGLHLRAQLLNLASKVRTGD